MAYHDQSVRRVEASRIQVDEIWTFTYAKRMKPLLSKARKRRSIRRNFRLTHYLPSRRIDSLFRVAG